MDEKLKILTMVEEGKITAEEGMELLKALGDENQSEKSGKDGRKRFLRIDVQDGEETKVNVNIPLALLKVGAKFKNVAFKFIPEDVQNELGDKGIDLEEIDIDELLNMIDNGVLDGPLVDVNDGEDKVRIYVE